MLVLLQAKSSGMENSLHSGESLKSQTGKHELKLLQNHENYLEWSRHLVCIKLFTFINAGDHKEECPCQRT